MPFSIVSIDIRSARIALEGDFDAATIGALQRELSSLLRRPLTRVEVDVSDLRLMDTAGVGLLIDFFKKLSAQGCLLRLSGLRNFAIFALLKLERISDRSPPPN